MKFYSILNRGYRHWVDKIIFFTESITHSSLLIKLDGCNYEFKKHDLIEVITMCYRILT